ncbi:MAG: hypothetical protein BRD48_03935 [Bacteroidetes bacterium QS_9_68_14]|nr:MAG: hypothetical protein BRD48_03935 [Bacteroidetes bacterium QS_9_68_14]
MPTAKPLLERLRTWFARDVPPEADEDPDTRAEIEAYLTEQRADMCQWLLVVRAGGALGVAGYLALSALMTSAAYPSGALLLAVAYAMANGAVCLGTTYLTGGTGLGRAAPCWGHAFTDVALVMAVYSLFGGALAGGVAPGVVLVGLLVLVLLVYTLLGYPVLSTTLALASLSVAAGAFYVVPEAGAGPLPPSGASAAPMRAYLLVEYLSIACLVTCLLALRLRRRRAAHRTELHRRLRSQVEADLEGERRRQAEALGQLKRDFISVLSHELRNPVAPLVSSLEVVQQDAAKGRCNAPLVDIAARSAYQLQHLVNDYTRLARLLTRPPEHVTRQNVPLAPLVEATASHLTERFAGHPARRLPDAPPPPRFALDDLAGRAVAADPSLLGAALRALLLRATRYAVGEAPVTVRGFAENGEAGFTVHDPNSALDADALASLDEDLFAPTDERLYSDEATGLELLLAQHALRRLGGRLDAKRHAEGGTTIRCTLPAASEAHDWTTPEQARRLPADATTAASAA